MILKRKHTALFLLSIYLAVFAHNVIPHHHHSQIVDEVVHTVLQDHEHHHHDADHHHTEDSDHHQNELGNHCHDSHKHEYHQFEARPGDVSLTLETIVLVSTYIKVASFSYKEALYAPIDFQQKILSGDYCAHSLRGPPVIA